MILKVTSYSYRLKDALWNVPKLFAGNGKIAPMIKQHSVNTMVRVDTLKIRNVGYRAVCFIYIKNNYISHRHCHLKTMIMNVLLKNLSKKCLQKVWTLSRHTHTGIQLLNKREKKTKPFSIELYGHLLWNNSLRMWVASRRLNFLCKIIANNIDLNV